MVERFCSALLWFNGIAFYALWQFAAWCTPEGHAVVTYIGTAFPIAVLRLVGFSAEQVGRWLYL
jgi:hypothetical protein